MPDLATLTTWLEEARLALHRHTIGGMTTKIQAPDRRSVEKSITNRVDLTAYIRDLEDQIARLEGTYRARGPMRLGF